MLQIVMCVVVTLIQFGLFLIFGNMVNNITGIRKKGLQSILIGFFAYYAVLQVVYLPMVFLRLSFTTLTIVWSIICALLVAKTIICDRQEMRLIKRRLIHDIYTKDMYIMCISLLVMLAVVIYQACRNYLGFDMAYYVGTINTTIYRDSMYIYNGESGLQENYLPVRYALSCFYMNSAIWCKLFKMAPVIYQHYVGGGMCVMLSYIVMLLIGKKIFRGNLNKAYIYAALILVIGSGFLTVYNSMDFLFYRAYEAKGYCANVIIPSIFYAALYVWDKEKKRQGWYWMFIIGAASVAVSMSAVLIIPAMIMIIALAESILKKRIKYIFYGIACITPNMAYAFMYFLYSQKIWLIKI